MSDGAVACGRRRKFAAWFVHRCTKCCLAVRRNLKPGETRPFRFELAPDDLAFWDIGMNWSAEPSQFSISVGNSTAALATVRLTVQPPEGTIQ